ncbi:MAG: hypothetical protein QW818_01515 [Candidatus Aenigmatarchaeota archaeon]|nr:hypothetical protein [Candidatus Aenigmarchaeota archaeon]
MANIFQIAVERLVEVGFYNFLLPFILFTAILYAVLRKTQILGDSPIIHGIVSVAVGLFVFGMPVLVGADISGGLSAFLTQGVIGMLVVIFGFLIASFFYPNISEKLPEIFRGGGPATWLIWAVVGFAAAFGLFAFVQKPIAKALTAAKVPGELIAITIVLMIIFAVFLIVAMAGGKEVK